MAELKPRTVFSFTRERSQALARSRGTPDPATLRTLVTGALKMPPRSGVADYRILRALPARGYPRKYAATYALETEPRVFAVVYRLDGVTFRLRLAVRKAAAQCPSLNGRRITSHRIRNSCAMALLQAGVAIEVIALYLGHATPQTTHHYVEADLKMKADCLRRLTEPKAAKRQPRAEPSRLLAFLEAVK